jgi:hypothetical protein
MLDDISLYWFTNIATSSARLYWENYADNFNAVSISIPAGISAFPGEIYKAPRSCAERSYHDLIYFNEVDKGGHFAAWEGARALRRRAARRVPITALGREVEATSSPSGVTHVTFTRAGDRN